MHIHGRFMFILFSFEQSDCNEITIEIEDEDEDEDEEEDRLYCARKP